VVVASGGTGSCRRDEIDLRGLAFPPIGGDCSWTTVGDLSRALGQDVQPNLAGMPTNSSGAVTRVPTNTWEPRVYFGLHAGPRPCARCRVRRTAAHSGTCGRPRLMPIDGDNPRTNASRHLGDRRVRLEAGDVKWRIDANPLFAPGFQAPAFSRQWRRPRRRTSASPQFGG
jgi:hypothetical protein